MATDLYSRSLELTLARDHRFARRLQTVLGDPATSDRVLSAVDFSPWTRRNFARWLFEDYPRAALATPDRWRRGLFEGPGAFSGLRPQPAASADGPLPVRS